MVPLLRDANRDVRRQASRALEVNGTPAAIPPLRELLRDKEADVRRSAASLLSSLHAKEAAADLVGLLADESVDVRVAALHALGHLEAGEATAEVARSLDSPEARVRAAAVWALGDLRSAGHGAALLKALEDKDREVRVSAVYALWRARPEGAGAALVARLRDPDELVRIRAVHALGELLGKEAAPHLVPLMDVRPEPRRDGVLEPGWARGPGVGEWAVRVLCGLGIREGLEANRARLRGEGAPSPFHLNALRQPELWARLDGLPRRTWEPRDGRRQLEALAREGGLAIEEVPDPFPIPGLRRGLTLRFHECRRREGSYLDQLHWAAGDAGFEAIMDPGRIRLLEPGRALDEWRAWAKK
jgi:HEAT repeat protein